MKKFAGIMLLVVALGFMSIAISAQETVEEVFTPDTTGVLVQVAPSGSFVVAEDGSVTLTFAPQSSYGSFIITQPEISMLNYDLADFSDDWTFAETLVEDFSATGYLQADGYIISMTLDVASYDLDTGEVSYDVSIDSVRDLNAVDPKEAPTAPATFADGSLYITLDAPFLNTLFAGFEARLSEMRDGTESATCWNCGP